MIELAYGLVVLLAVFYEWRATAAANRFQKERDQWARERQVLLNRIRPESAQPVPGVVEEDEPAVTFDSDTEFWAAKGVEAQ